MILLGFQRSGIQTWSQNNSEFLFNQIEALEARRASHMFQQNPPGEPGHVNSTLADRPDGDG